jgi:hypothetical protein
VFIDFPKTSVLGWGEGLLLHVLSLPPIEEISDVQHVSVSNTDTTQYNTYNYAQLKFIFKIIIYINVPLLVSCPIYNRIFVGAYSLYSPITLYM